LLIRKWCAKYAICRLSKRRRGTAIVDTSRGILVVSHGNRTFYLPGGGAEKGESQKNAAIRELKEETGLVPLHLWVVPNVNSFYSQDNDSISLIPVFVAQVSEDAEVIISDEHSEYFWTDGKHDQTLLAWEGQRKSVKLIEEYFLREMNYLQFTEIDLGPLLNKI